MVRRSVQLRLFGVRVSTIVIRRFPTLPDRPRMRWAFQLVFVIFYSASSYAIAQERVRVIVDELQHSVARSDGLQFDDGCNQLRNGFPNFRQAKPQASCILYFGLTQNFELWLVEAEREFHTRSHPLKSLDTIERILSRAPPFQRRPAERRN
jgi:hypothetical protein